MVLAVSASEAEAVEQALEEPISLDDARAIAKAQAELDRSVAADASAAADAEVAEQDPQQSRKHRGQYRGGRGEAGAGVRRSRSTNSACETIREESEIQPADNDGQPRPSITLRDCYTTTVAVPQEFTDAELAAYEHIQAVKQGGGSGSGSSSSSSSGSGNVRPPNQKDSDDGYAIHRSDDTACEFLSHLYRARRSACWKN